MLITLGGADPRNLTVTVLEALDQVAGPLEVRVLVGPANPHLAALRRAAAGAGQRVELLVDPPDVPAHMTWAEVAISAAGGTCWELAALGVPLLLIVAAENQRPTAEALDERQLAVVCGLDHADIQPAQIASSLSALLDDSRRRQAISSGGWELIDGQGARRVVEQLRRLTICMRDAAPGDARLLWHWANDPQSRRASFSSDSISWEEHSAWFDSKIGDPACKLRLSCDISGTPLAVVRFEVKGPEAVISLNVDPARRGAGHGSRLVSLASRRLFFSGAADTILALVKPDNEASLRTFRRAGFLPAGETTIAGQPALRFRLRKDDL